MSLIITTIPPFDYNASDQSTQRGAKANMLKRILLLKFEHHFSPTENYFSNQGAMGEDILSDIGRKNR